MNFKMDGEFRVERTPEDVFDFLSDPRRFAPLLPDFEDVKMEDDVHAVVTLRVGVAHIRGKAAMKLVRREAERPYRAVYEGSGDIPGGTATLVASFELQAAEGGGTTVKWTGQAQIVGRLPSLAGGLLEPMARRNVQAMIDSLQRAMAKPE